MHTYDLNLTLQDLQGLHDANSLVGFFTALGYDTKARTIQTAANLGISEAVQQRIRRVELLSDNARFLQVYLFEMKSVTVADIRAIRVPRSSSRSRPRVSRRRFAEAEGRGKGRGR
jgi:hypothetical protein